jgi:cytochrome oxidase Cu insertion factor (SCO1/SenC/PrrC family)
MRDKLLLGLLFVVVPALFAGVAAFVLLGRSQSGPSYPTNPYRGSQPPDRIVVPNVSLRSYRGPLVSLRRPAGKVLVLTGVDSKCKDKCPILVSTVAQALPLLSASERVSTRAIAYSVDPRIDKPASVRRFLRQRRALALEYLVDTVPRMRPFWRQLHVLTAFETGKADFHSADVRVYDRRGLWVSTLHAGVDLTAANLAHDIKTALERSSE